MPSGATGIAFGRNAVARSGANDTDRASVYALIWPAVCSRMLWPPVSTQRVLCKMRSIIASAWTPEPRR